MAAFRITAKYTNQCHYGADNVAVCFKCNMVVNCAGGTTNLTSHIRWHHPLVLLPKDKKSTCAAKTSPSTETVKGPTAACNTIGQLFASKYASSSGRSKLITSKIARFLVKDLRPYSYLHVLISCDMRRVKLHFCSVDKMKFKLWFDVRKLQHHASHV